MNSRNKMKIKEAMFSDKELQSVLNDLLRTSSNNLYSNTTDYSYSTVSVCDNKDSIIESVLNEDVTIDLIKRYLLKFIEDNIDNPEKLLKDYFIERDEELKECKERLSRYEEELKICQQHINILADRIAALNNGNGAGYYPYPNPYFPPITFSNGTNTSGSGIVEC